MSTLVFNNQELKVIDHNGRRWFTAASIAKALGYNRADAVSRVYKRNAQEFTCRMVETVSLTVSGNLKRSTRIFSLRGAHLIAMHARKSQTAQAFRVWVLDLLDKEVERLREQVQTPQPTIDDFNNTAWIVRLLPNGTRQAQELPELRENGGNGRYFVSMDKGQVAHAERVGDGAMVCSTSTFADYVRQHGAYITDSVLGDIAMACLHRLNPKEPMQAVSILLHRDPQAFSTTTLHSMNVLIAHELQSSGVKTRLACGRR